MSSKPLIGLLFLVGCGGAAPAGPEGAKAPPIAAEAEATFAVFHGTPPKDAAKTVRLRLRSPPSELTAFLADTGSAPEITVTTIPNDDQLPLRREVLVAEAGPHGRALESAAAVSLVHAEGRPGARQGLLRWTAWAALLAAGDDGVIVDLATWKSLDSKGFQDALAAPGWLEAQVVPSIWEESPTALGFATRGMARLGLPDVEQGGVPKADGRPAFEAFMAAVTELRTQGQAALGTTVGAFTLVPCERPREAYTRTCVRLKAAP